MKLALRSLLTSTLLLLPVTAVAEWVENGNRVTLVESMQQDLALTSDGAGGVIAVWTDYRDGEVDIYAQRFTSDGVALWDPNGVRLTASPGVQRAPQIVSDGAGGAFVAWIKDDFAFGEFRALRITSSGTPATGWPAAGLLAEPWPSAYYFSPLSLSLRLVSDGAGGALLVGSAIHTTCNFTPNCYSYPRGAFAHWLTPTGMRWGSPVAVSGDPYENVWLAPAQTGPDAFEIAVCRETYPWLDRTRVDASGTATSRPTIAVPPYGFRRVSAAPDGNAGMFALWERYTSESRLLHFDPAGAVSSGWPSDGMLLPGEPYSVASDEQGGALLLAPGSGTETRLRRLTTSAGDAPGWPAEGVTVTGGFSLVTGDGSGGALLAGNRGGDLVAQHVLGGAEQDPAWPEDGVPFCTVPAYKYGLTQLRAGTALYVGWGRSGGTDPFETASRRVYLQRIVIDSPVPALVSLASAGAEPNRVSIRWVLGQAAGALDVERNSGAGWARHAAVLAGRDEVAFEDADVTPGARYGYRLRDREGVVLSGSEVWLDVPLATLSIRALGLGGAAPEFAVTLPRAGAADIEIVDVAGRRLASHRVEGLPAGSHHVRVDRSLVSGVWFARLSQGGQSATTRFCAIR